MRDVEKPGDNPTVTQSTKSYSSELQDQNKKQAY